MIELGGNIKLIGFKDVEPGKLVVVKKIVGNYAKRISDRTSLNELSVHIKEIHSSSKEVNKKFEVKAKLISNKNDKNSEVIDYNLFFAIDRALSKIMEGIS